MLCCKQSFKEYLEKDKGTKGFLLISNMRRTVYNRELNLSSYFLLLFSQMHMVVDNHMSFGMYLLYHY